MVSDDVPEQYRVEVSDVAQAQIDAAFLYLSARSPNAAMRWLTGLGAAIDSLALFPRRCPLAPENDLYENASVRRLLYGSRRSAYRILYCIFEQDREVRILQVRHGARATPHSPGTGGDLE